MKTRVCLSVWLTLFLLAGSSWPAVTPAAVAEPTSTGDWNSGQFSWDDVTLEYSGGLSGQTVTATIFGADGTVLAESVVTAEKTEVTIAGIQLTSQSEVTDEEAQGVAEFAATNEAAAIRALAASLAGAKAVDKRIDVLGFSAIALVLGEGAGMPQFAMADCFGCCGPGCWGCFLLGSCYTLACAAHDGCVANWGPKHPACLALLLVAIASYLAECL